MLDRILEVGTAVRSEALAGLTADERDVLVTLLVRVRANLRDLLSVAPAAAAPAGLPLAAGAK
ncbi:MAG: hypothetical protein ACREFQ_14470 [Stellaceae bacterium]